jgi:hypothetical protein
MQLQTGDGIRRSKTSFPVSIKLARAWNYSAVRYENRCVASRDAPLLALRAHGCLNAGVFDA